MQYKSCSRRCDSVGDGVCTYRRNGQRTCNVMCMQRAYNGMGRGSIDMVWRAARAGGFRLHRRTKPEAGESRGARGSRGPTSPYLGATILNPLQVLEDLSAAGPGNYSCEAPEERRRRKRIALGYLGHLTMVCVCVCCGRGRQGTRARGWCDGVRRLFSACLS
jgi:hypothetical protein